MVTFWTDQFCLILFIAQLRLDHMLSHTWQNLYIDTYLALVISQPIRVFFAIYRPCFLIVHIHNNFTLYTNETIIHFGA